MEIILWKVNGTAAFPDKRIGVPEFSLRGVDLQARPVGDPNHGHPSMVELSAEFCESRYDVSTRRKERVHCAKYDGRCAAQAMLSDGLFIVANRGIKTLRKKKEGGQNRCPPSCARPILGRAYFCLT